MQSIVFTIDLGNFHPSYLLGLVYLAKLSSFMVAWIVIGTLLGGNRALVLLLG